MSSPIIMLSSHSLELQTVNIFVISGVRASADVIKDK